MPWIYPRTDIEEPLWKLGDQLAALGGVRGQDYTAAPGVRWHYQVASEDLYLRWVATLGVPAAADPAPTPTVTPEKAQQDPAQAEPEATPDAPEAEDTTDATAGTAAKPNQRPAKTARTSASRKG